MGSSQEAQGAVAKVLERGYRGFDPSALVVGSVAEAVDRFGALEQVGYTDVVLRNISQDQAVALQTIEHLAEVKAQLS